jgi:hypothetical protein
MKYLKIFESFSKVNEKISERKIEDVINKFKKDSYNWNIAKRQFIGVITEDFYVKANESPEVFISMKELREFYPNWTTDDFKEVYLALEGELPKNVK